MLPYGKRVANFLHFEGISLLRQVLITNVSTHKKIRDQSINLEKVLYNIFHRSKLITSFIYGYSLFSNTIWIILFSHNAT